MASRRSRSRSRSSTRSSSRSQSTARSSGRGTPTASKKPAIDRDGKASIACPNCGQRYKILEEALEDKVKCTQCHRVFYPLAAASARRPKQDPTKAVVTVAAIVIGLVAVGAVINSMSGPGEPPPQPKDTNAAKPAPKLDSSTAEVRTAMNWARALSEQNQLDLIANSDMAALQKFLKVDPKNSYAHSVGSARKALDDQIVEALLKGPEALVFRAFTPSFGRISEAAMVAAKQGTVRMSLSPKDAKINHDSATALLSYEWNHASKRFLITAWKTTYVHPAHTRKFNEDTGRVEKKHVTHKVLGKAKTVRKEHLGRTIKVREAAPKPLPHLKETSAADQQKIDDLITKLIDLHGPGMLYNRAERELLSYSKAAVPRLLNKMFEYQGLKTQDDVDIVNRLCRCLRSLTGQRYGFNPMETTEVGLGATTKERISIIRQWFGYWADYHDRKDWAYAIDTNDDLLTDEERAAKKKAEAAGKKQDK